MLQCSYAAAAAGLNAMLALVNGGSVKIYNGTMPATLETAADGTLLGTLGLSATAFGAASNVGGDAKAIANPVSDDTSADADGAPTYFRLCKPDGTAEFQGDCGDTESSAFLQFDVADFTLGQTISVASFYIIFPAATVA